ncbi:MAG: hypothetical protein HYV48_00980 [Candidatus Omnitrophica bacterium]|nr:hypothetical protein [Candidatus Omnitrophota bacterium]
MYKNFITAGLIIGLAINTCCQAAEEKPAASPKKMIYSYGVHDGSWLDMGSPYAITGSVDTSSDAAFPAAIYGKGSANFVHTINLHFSLEQAQDMVFIMDILSESGGDKNVSAEELKVFLNGELIQTIDLFPESPKPEEERQRTVQVAGDWYNCWFDSVTLYKPEVK